MDLKVAILEDNDQDATLQQSFFERFGQESGVNFLIQRFGDGAPFLANFHKGDFQLVMMDIEMPTLNGLATSKKLREIDSDVILVFVTNLAQFAIDGYAVNALDYIVKPISYPDFSLKLKKVMRYAKLVETRRIPLPIRGQTVLVDADKITYVEVIRHYLVYHYGDEEVTVRGTMKNAVQAMPPFFAQCGNSFLVNLRYVDEIRANSVVVAGKELPLTRLKKAEFMTAMASFMGGTEKPC